MITLTQSIRIHHTDGSVDVHEKTHLYTHGHFTEGGWHIELGTGKNPSDFTEVVEPGTTNPIPESLPDIDVYEEDDADATIEDYEEALTEIFGEDQT